MSYPIPHFRDADEENWRERAEMAEAALAHMRRYAGRPTRVADEPMIPPRLTIPPLREMPAGPVAPPFIPSQIGSGLPDWTVIAAGTFLFLLPVAIFTFLLRNHLLRGMSFGAIRK